MTADHDRIRQAIDRLAAALYELGYRDRISIKPEIRMLLAPGDPTTADVRHMHAIGLTARLAERLADATEQLLTQDPTGGREFEQANPELAAEINSAFSGIDLSELTGTTAQEAEDDA